MDSALINLRWKQVQGNWDGKMELKYSILDVVTKLLLLTKMLLENGMKNS